jgi:hypothetical protein
MIGAVRTSVALRGKMRKLSVIGQLAISSDGIDFLFSSFLQAASANSMRIAL